MTFFVMCCLFLADEPVKAPKNTSEPPAVVKKASSEDLKLDRNGRLERRGRAGETIIAIGIGILRRIDLDRSGSLNKKEIETGLRLTRLLGLGPMSDPRLYRAAPPGTEVPHPPANRPKKSAKRGGYL